MNRYPSDENLEAMDGEGTTKGGRLKDLATIQRDKFSHFFTYLLDHDKDGFIDRKDFRMLSEVSTSLDSYNKGSCPFFGSEKSSFVYTFKIRGLRNVFLNCY